MTARTRPSGQPYHESAEFQWTETAFGMLGTGELHGQISSVNGIISTRIWGLCPRCRACHR